ncbi:hypothetical protein B1B04_05295 [Lysinibacillus sp. KCTC 33748]|nr:hypothetical protein B1B04_05295 [Lysinibacillus sp. KCTC 33748]
MTLHNIKIRTIYLYSNKHLLNRGTQSKNTTSCGNLSVRNIGATATNVFCAKAERQQQMFSVRKRSDSNNYGKAK